MNLKYLLSKVIGFIALSLFGLGLSAQVMTSATQTNGSSSSNLVTAVPFLLITPDARVGAMGDAGVAILPDVNSGSNNPSKLAFLNQTYGFSISYSPWLKNLASDINLGYLSGYYKLNDRNTIGGSLRYFSLGKIQLTDANQQDLGSYSPNEFALDGSFARRFGDSFSLATTLRYVRSNLASGQFNAGQEIKAANALAVDVSAYYKQGTQLLGTDAQLAAGINISNVGGKMTYTTGGNRYFLPANLKLGAASTFLFNDLSEFTLGLDFNKLLVPTQADPGNGRVDTSVPAGIFGSFTDAPGGLKEELKEVSVSTGVEYTYKHQFALRGGYSYENPQKGNRSYFTLGAGFKYDVMGIDFSYLIASQEKSPLANTLRFSLLFNFGESNR